MFPARGLNRDHRIPLCTMFSRWPLGNQAMCYAGWMDYASSGLDIGYVPAGPHTFLRLSGQFGPPQFIYHWHEGPVFFLIFFFFNFFFFSASYATIIFTGNRQNSEGNVNSYLFFVIYRPNVQKCATWNHKFQPRKHLGHYMFLGGQWVFWGASGFSDSLAPRASGCHSPTSRPAVVYLPQSGERLQRSLTICILNHCFS